ncbi:MAG: beta-ketoacyl-ACP synthase II, partial [Planctomycetia bacterium]
MVITGMGALTPLGGDLPGFWEDLCAGRSGIGTLERFDGKRLKVHCAGEIKDFQPQPYIDPREMRRLDRFSAFALVAAAKAVEDAGLSFGDEDVERCGVMLGSAVGGLAVFDEAYEKLHVDPTRLSPLLIPRMMVNAASGHVSIRFGLRGPNSAIATACASASNAIGDAYKAIQRDDADIMVTGGSEAAVTPLGLAGFAAMRALSARSDDPTRASRPFDRDRDGFVLSEGSGILVLEELRHAQRRKARIYAEVVGYGSSADGLHIAAPDPTGRGAGRAMQAALADARLNLDDVAYVNAHATGTILGDRAETTALKYVFGPHARRLWISSTKSSIGHLLGASGGVELIVTALAVHHGVVPPTINLDAPDPECDLDYVPHHARPLHLQYALSNSFG